MHKEILRYCVEWPAMDRDRWLQKLKPASRLRERSTVAAAWRDQTRKDYTIGYTHGLRWLAASAVLDPEQPPSERWNAVRLHAYVRDLIAQGYSTTTVQIRVIAIDRVLSQIEPEFDRSFVKRQLKKLPRHESDTSKLLQLKPSSLLKTLGTQLMSKAEEDDCGQTRVQIRYRTGFQIALLAARPMRLKNFAMLEIGENIFPKGESHWIYIKAAETKKGTAIDLSFPDDLATSYERYVGFWREKLRGQYDGSRLWVSSRQGPLNENAIYKQIVSSTEKYFGPGQAVNPHVFRDCLATSIANDDPAEWDLAHRILGNTKFTVERHYDHGGTRAAGLEVNAYFDALRAKN